MRSYVGTLKKHLRIPSVEPQVEVGQLLAFSQRQWQVGLGVARAAKHLAQPAVDDQVLVAEEPGLLGGMPREEVGRREPVPEPLGICRDTYYTLKMTGGSCSSHINSSYVGELIDTHQLVPPPLGNNRQRGGVGGRTGTFSP